jgi:hypothetical protein
LIQTGVRRGYKEAKHRKKKIKTHSSQKESFSARRSYISSPATNPGRYKLRKREIYNWCTVRPIPQEIWDTWDLYFSHDWEIYDKITKTVVALGSKEKMEASLRVLLEQDRFEYSEESAAR